MELALVLQAKLCRKANILLVLSISPFYLSWFKHFAIGSELLFKDIFAANTILLFYYESQALEGYRMGCLLHYPWCPTLRTEPLLPADSWNETQPLAQILDLRHAHLSETGLGGFFSLDIWNGDWKEASLSLCHPKKHGMARAHKAERICHGDGRK